MKRSKPKMAIYGGSFNPIHQAHVNIAQMAIDYLKLDELIFMPTYDNPLKQPTAWRKINPKHRLAMIKRCLGPKMTVSDYELVNKISQTYQTIRYYTQLFPDREWYFIIGSDNLNTLDQWDQIDLIAKWCQIVCFQRNQIVTDHPNLNKYRILLVNNPLFIGSSTDYHQLNFHLVPKQVQNYIGTNLLYWENFYQDLDHQQLNFVIKELRVNHWTSHQPLMTDAYLRLICMILSYVHKHQLKPKNLNALSTIAEKIYCNWIQYQAKPKYPWITILDRLIQQIIDYHYYDQQLIVVAQTLLKLFN